ncbi:unnamed protein product [Ranitomeya imitator]|uniref:Uncharacterized protein n=1 Tax=Ranitomeya imitator TaxID=111125 RepID=A0ABN9LX38_9NEOB|nr:unnamed protein product [Ranitomeya imitator]
MTQFVLAVSAWTVSAEDGEDTQRRSSVERRIGRQWMYQTCTEFGYFQSSDSVSQPFSGFPLRADPLSPWCCHGLRNLVTVVPEFLWIAAQCLAFEDILVYFTLSDRSYLSDFLIENSYHVQQCTDVYGKDFNLPTVVGAIQQTNENYGGLNVQSSRIIFPNGLIDPWHALGINSNLSSDLLAFPMQAATLRYLHTEQLLNDSDPWRCSVLDSDLVVFDTQQRSGSCCDIAGRS